MNNQKLFVVWLKGSQYVDLFWGPSRDKVKVTAHRKLVNVGIDAFADIRINSVGAVIKDKAHRVYRKDITYKEFLKILDEDGIKHGWPKCN